jgi:hypothetical protein
MANDTDNKPKMFSVSKYLRKSNFPHAMRVFGMSQELDSLLPTPGKAHANLMGSLRVVDNRHPSLYLPAGRLFIFNILPRFPEQQRVLRHYGPHRSQRWRRGSGGHIGLCR